MCMQDSNEKKNTWHSRMNPALVDMALKLCVNARPTDLAQASICQLQLCSAAQSLQ